MTSRLERTSARGAATAVSRIVMDVSVNRYKRAVKAARELEGRIDSARRLGASYAH